MEAIIRELKQEAKMSWGGTIGEKRASDLEVYLRHKLKEYSDLLRVEKKEILEKWEVDRSYSAINYYQEANQPTLSSERVRIFDTLMEMYDAVKDFKFRCPACYGISSDPYECTSREVNGDGKRCNWTVDGLFGDLDKGIYVFCKDEMVGETIFMPLVWEKSGKLSKV